MSTGFTWETQDRETDIAAAKQTWASAEALLKDPACQVVLLDELTYMLTYGYLESDRVLEAIRNRPGAQHVIITGRNASKALNDLADTVSEVQDIKHAFNNGIRVQKGIDY
jgi:cob(I)alamin adenosyltransferase